MRTCKFIGCENKTRYKDYCPAHYWQLKNLKELKPLYSRYNKEKNCLNCGVSFKKEKHRGRGLCHSCWCKQNYKLNIEERKKYKKIYGKSPKGKEIDKRKNHNRRLVLSGTKVPKNFIFQKLEINDHKCGNIYCVKKIDINTLWLEHYLPVSRGGTNDPQNLDVWCPNCNNRKYNKTLEEFYLEEQKRLGFSVF